MNMKTLQDAVIHELKDILHAEKQLAKALPKMAKAASHPELQQAFEEHASQTEQHVERVKKAFDKLGKPPRAETCEAMKGLIEEAEDLTDQDGDPNVLDAELICAAQKVEHYEIAAYGTICTWLEQLGEHEALELCKQNLAEEKQTDERLSELATHGINVEAPVAAER